MVWTVQSGARRSGFARREAAEQVTRDMARGRHSATMFDSSGKAVYECKKIGGQTISCKFLGGLGGGRRRRRRRRR